MKKILALPLLVLVTACSLVPDYHRPALALPEGWRETVAKDETDLSDWWPKLKNKELAALEEKALAQNLDLKAAQARIAQARAAGKIADAALFPQADATASVGAGQSRTPRTPPQRGTSGSAAVGVSYELDLFGANRAAAEAAEAGVDSSVFDHAALSLVVSAEVAKTYATALALKGRIAVAQDNRRDLKKTLDLLQSRLDAGAVGALDVEQQKAAVATADAAVATLRTALSVSLDALAVLEGEPPQGFRISGESLSELAVPAIVPAQPSTLLERRPDIRKAEADLVAANADIGVARAAFFPSISLGASAGLSAASLASPATTALQAAASLSAPLFRGGSLTAGVDRARAREEELAQNYRKAVLTSFQEAEDALATADGAAARQKSYAAATVAAQKAYDIADESFKAGGIDYLSLLESERSLLSAKDNLVSANLDRFTAAVDLYKALGGGWKARFEGSGRRRGL